MAQHLHWDSSLGEQVSTPEESQMDLSGGTTVRSSSVTHSLVIVTFGCYINFENHLAQLSLWCMPWGCLFIPGCVPCDSVDWMHLLVLLLHLQLLLLYGFYHVQLCLRHSK